MDTIQLAEVLAQSPSEYHDWLKSLPQDECREEFFARILQRGLIDAVLITVRQAVAYRKLPDEDDELTTFVESQRA